MRFWGSNDHGSAFVPSSLKITGIVPTDTKDVLPAHGSDGSQSLACLSNSATGRPLSERSSVTGVQLSAAERNRALGSIFHLVLTHAEG